MNRVRVGDVAEQVRGVTFSKKDSSKEHLPGHVPVLTASNITEDGLRLSPLQYVPAGMVRATQKLRTGDILVTASSGSLDVVGRAVFVDRNLDAAFGAFCKVLRFGDEVEPRYAAHYFRTAEYRSTVSQLAAGANINNLKNEDLDGIKLPLPPLPEQRRIAALLDEADSISQMRSNTLEHLALVEASILQAMLDRTNGSRRRVMFGEIVESSQLGLVRGSNEFGAVGEFGYLRMDAITRSGRVDLRLVQRTDADAKELARAGLRDGDLLFNTRNSRELVGKSAVFYGPSKTLFNNNILRVRFKEDVSPAYIAAMLRTGEVKSQLEARKRGTTSVFAVYYRDLASIELEIPSATEMDAFEMSVRRVQEIRLASERALKITDQLKAALRSKAFKGEL